MVLVLSALLVLQAPLAQLVHRESPVAQVLSAQPEQPEPVRPAQQAHKVRPEPMAHL